MHTTPSSADAHSETLYAAALWLLQQERPADAMHLFRMMLLAAPADERGWLGLGTAHERLEQPDIAIELYAMAKDTARSPRCALARGRLLRHLGRDDEAEAAFDDAELAAEAASDDDVAALVSQIRRAS